MKRYLFGILAVAFVLGVVAFDTPDKNFTNKRFRYMPPLGSYDGPDVQQKTNWVYQPSTVDCSTDNAERACEILVPPAQVTNDNKLVTNFSITAAEHLSTGVFYVDAITDGAIYNDDY